MSSSSRVSRVTIVNIVIILVVLQKKKSELSLPLKETNPVTSN